MISRLCLLLLFAALVAPLRAQEEPVHMRPEFPLVFPLASNGAAVTVKYPVLINAETVVKPGMQLRVLYVLSHDSQYQTDLALAHSSSLDNSFGRESNSGGPDPAKMPAELAHEIDNYRRTVWEVPNNFMLALAQYPVESMHLIFSPTGKEKLKDLHDVMFRFFDGLFIGSPNGKVTVIAVEKESKSEQAGIKAGDEIVAVGAYPTRDDLLTFAAAYDAAKRDARNAEVDAYAVQVRGADGTTRMASVAMPQRIKGGLMDGFSEKP